MMLFSLHRDLASLHLVRCFAKLPGKSYGVGGAGFSIKQAVAKCRSEYAERIFDENELAPLKIKPLGIAAHPSDFLYAHQSAQLEVLETLLLARIKHTGTFEGFRIFNRPSFSLSIQAIKGYGYFAALRTIYRGKPLLSYSARKTVAATLLKVWEESRNPNFHNTPIEDMPRYSKSTKLFSDEELCEIEFKHSTNSIDAPNMGQIEFVTDFYLDHHIAYAISKKE